MNKRIKEINLMIPRNLKRITNYILRTIFKIFIYCSLFMTMELGGRFIRYSDSNGFVPVPVLMILVYMHIAWMDDLIIPFFNKKNIPKWLQAFFIMLLILIFEFSFGIFFKYILNINVWDYSRAKFFGYPAHLFGVVSLYGIFAWYGIAWFLLWLYPKIKIMTTVKS